MRGANGRDESWTTGNIRVGNVPEVAFDLQERYGTSFETAIRLVAAASALAGSIKGAKGVEILPLVNKPLALGSTDRSTPVNLNENLQWNRLFRILQRVVHCQFR